METPAIKSKRTTEPVPAPTGLHYLTDREAAWELGVGLTKLAELQRDDPAFPAPIWFGTRSKRHDRAALHEYAAAKRGKHVVAAPR